MPMTGTRTRFTIAIGCNDAGELDEYTDRLVEEISRFTAGATVLHGAGYWRTDGNGSAPYTGDLQVESNRTVTFVTDMDRGRALDALKTKARTVHAELRPEGIEWLNVEAESVEVEHFDASTFVPSGDGAPTEEENDTGARCDHCATATGDVTEGTDEYGHRLELCADCWDRINGDDEPEGNDTVADLRDRGTDGDTFGDPSALSVSA